MLGSGPLASGPIASSASGAYVVSLGAGSFVFTGYSDAAENEHSLPLQPGAFAFAGGALGFGEAYLATLSVGAFKLTILKPFSPVRRIFDEAPATYTLTGSSAVTRRNRALGAQPATYTLTGSPAGTSMSPAPMTAAKGVFRLSGFVSVTTARSLVEQPGVVTLNGRPCNLMVYGGLPVARGQFLFAFPQVAMVRTRKMVQSPGAFVSTGSAVGVSAATGGQGTVTPFVLTGEPVTLTTTRNLSLAAGAFAVRAPSVLAVRQQIPEMTVAAASFAIGGGAASLARQLVLVQVPGTFEVIARDTSFGYDDGEVVREAVVSVVCSFGSTRTAPWRPSNNPVNGMVLDAGRFGVTPAMAGLGRQMAIEAGDFALTGVAA